MYALVKQEDFYRLELLDSHPLILHSGLFGGGSQSPKPAY